MVVLLLLLLLLSQFLIGPKIIIAVSLLSLPLLLLPTTTYWSLFLFVSVNWTLNFLSLINFMLSIIVAAQYTNLFDRIIIFGEQSNSSFEFRFFFFKNFFFRFFSCLILLNFMPMPECDWSNQSETEKSNKHNLSKTIGNRQKQYYCCVYTQSFVFIRLPVCKQQQKKRQNNRNSKQQYHRQQSI